MVWYSDGDFLFLLNQVEDRFRLSCPAWMPIDEYFNRYGPPVGNEPRECEMRVIPGFGTVTGFYGGTFERGKS